MKKIISSLLLLTSSLFACSHTSQNHEATISALETELEDYKNQLQDAESDLDEIIELFQESEDNIHYLCAVAIEMSVAGAVYVGENQFLTVENQFIQYDTFVVDCLNGLQKYKDMVQERHESLTSPPSRPE